MQLKELQPSTAHLTVCTWNILQSLIYKLSQQLKDANPFKDECKGSPADPCTRKWYEMDMFTLGSSDIKRFRVILENINLFTHTVFVI